MKQVSKLFAMVVAAAGTLLFSACDTDTDGENFYVSYGEVNGTAESYTIKTDAGNTLHIVENLLPTFPVEDGMRVRVNFTIQEQTGTDLNVRLNAIEKVLSKEPVYSSQLTSEELEELGNDPIYVENAWFGGKYLNIDFAVLRFDPQLAHFINLYVDEEGSDENNVVVVLKHNAYNDPTTSLAFGRVSFDISKLVPEGKESILVTLRWRNYDNSDCSDLGTFFLPNNGSSTGLNGIKDNPKGSASAVYGTIK